MGPTERGLKSVLDLMIEGDYAPKSGRVIPIEEIYAANCITYEQYQAILEEMKRERIARNRGMTADEMSGDSDMLADRMVKAKVPKTYIDCAVDTTKSKELASGTWVYVNGQNVDVVTRKACGLMKGWLRENPFGSALFERSTTMTAALRDLGNELEGISRFSSVGLLLISGLGAETPTDMTLSNLHAVLDTRAGNRMPTIITTRYQPSELAQHFGSRGNDGMARGLVKMLQEKSILVQV